MASSTLVRYASIIIYNNPSFISLVYFFFFFFPVFLLLPPGDKMIHTLCMSHSTAHRYPCFFIRFLFFSFLFFSFSFLFFYFVLLLTNPTIALYQRPSCHYMQSHRSAAHQNKPKGPSFHPVQALQRSKKKQQLTCSVHLWQT